MCHWHVDDPLLLQARKSMTLEQLELSLTTAHSRVDVLFNDFYAQLYFDMDDFPEYEHLAVTLKNHVHQAVLNVGVVQEIRLIVTKKTPDAASRAHALLTVFKRGYAGI